MDYKYEWIKKNEEPIEIEYVEDEHYVEKDLQPSFWWNNKRYYLSDFGKTHNNPWVHFHDIPNYIHGYEMNEYYNPLFIELIGDEAVNVYEERVIEQYV